MLEAGQCHPNSGRSTVLLCCQLQTEPHNIIIGKGVWASDVSSSRTICGTQWCASYSPVCLSKWSGYLLADKIIRQQICLTNRLTHQSTTPTNKQRHPTKILGVAYDTSLSFKDHIHDIKQKCTYRLNELRTLTETEFWQQTKKLWHPYTNNTTPRFWKTLVLLGPQTFQQIITTPYKLYRTTLYVSSLAAHKHAPTNHLHYDTQVLTLQDHINMRGTQFLAAANANPDHPCHYMLAHQPTPSSIKTTPQALYTGLLNTLPQHSNSYIHTHFTSIVIQKLGPNTILGTPHPKIHHSEHALPCVDRVHLSRLATYRKRIDETVDEVSIHCNISTHRLHWSSNQDLSLLRARMTLVGTKRPTSSNKTCSFKTSTGLYADQMLRQGRSCIAPQTAFQLTWCLRKTFPLAHKYGTAWAIEMTADRDEWFELNIDVFNSLAPPANIYS